MSLLTATTGDILRFLSFVEVLPNGCWFWTGARSRGKGNNKWYGSFSLNGHTIRAHRFSSEVFNGDECPRGYHRDHTCSFSLCVHPAHIIVLTHEQNQELKLKRKRAHLTLVVKDLNAAFGIVTGLCDNLSQSPEPHGILQQVISHGLIPSTTMEDDMTRRQGQSDDLTPAQADQWVEQEILKVSTYASIVDRIKSEKQFIINCGTMGIADKYPQSMRAHAALVKRLEDMISVQQ